MSEWTNQVEQHPIHDVLRATGAALETLLAQEVERDPSTTERLSRLQQVLTDVVARLSMIDSELIPLQTLNNLHQPIQRIADQLTAYQSNAQPDSVAAAHNQLENVLVHLNAIPVPRTTADIEDIREATTSLRRSISQNIRHLEAQSGESQGHLSAIEQQVKAVEAKIAESQERLDARFGEAEQRFTAAETQRASAFESAQAERDRNANTLHEEKTAEWESALEEQQSQFADLISETESEIATLKDTVESDSESILEELNAFKAEAQKLVGIITDTGMVGGYQKEANSAQAAGTKWRIMAALSLTGLVLFALYVFVTHAGQTSDTSWADVGWRVFVASAVGLLAAYAARQADKHDRTRKRSRKMELELASISPYLYALPEEQQIEMKMDLARRLFGQADSEDAKDDATTGTQADIAKLALESLQSLILKQ